MISEKRGVFYSWLLVVAPSFASVIKLVLDVKVNISMFKQIRIVNEIWIYLHDVISWIRRDTLPLFVLFIFILL